MRAALTSIMAVLVIAALFWGNCFSCPRMLLEQQSHGCCPHGKTKRSDCDTQSLKNFVKAEKAAAAPMLVEHVLPARVAVTPAELPITVSVPPEHTPPLQISLRI